MIVMIIMYGFLAMYDCYDGCIVSQYQSGRWGQAWLDKYGCCEAIVIDSCGR